MWLHDKIEEKVEQTRERIRRISDEHGDQKVGEVKVSHLFNGLRELDLLVSDVSYVDSEEGVHFRGFTVKEVLAQLPKAPGSEFPLLGGMYYLLLVGEMPTQQDALAMEEEFRHRSDLPYHVADMIRAMPRDTHPMTMFSQAILALQSRSEFTLLYNNGLQKQDYWRPTLKDGLGLVAKTPAIAAAIYNIKYLNHDMEIGRAHV